MSSTDQINHLAASRLCDKCNRPMALGKLITLYFSFLFLNYNILTADLEMIYKILRFHTSGFGKKILDFFVSVCHIKSKCILF